MASIQETIICAKEERRFLLKKLIEYDKDILLLDVKPAGEAGSCNGDTELLGATGESTSTSQMQPKTRKPYKKRDPNSKKAKKLPKPTKDKSMSPIVQTISVDNQYRPIYPINLGDSLTIFDMGEIVVNRLGYHNEYWIYPIGFVSTRLYGHMLEPSRKCVYTCKITDGGDFPMFVNFILLLITFNHLVSGS